MFILQADKNNLKIQEKEMVTSGSVSVYTCRFFFNEDWDNLDKTVVFKAANTTIAVEPELTMNPDNMDEVYYQCQIPWEVMQEHSRTLYIGVRGTQGEEIVLPTIWASAGTIKEGVLSADAGTDIPPNKYDELKEEISKKGDSLEYNGIDLSLLSDGEVISTVPIVSDVDPGDVVTGVLTFNGRNGRVEPQQGDYTAEMVGALPSSTSIPSMPEDVGADPAGAAEKVKQELLENLDDKLSVTGGTITGEVIFTEENTPAAFSAKKAREASNTVTVDSTGIHYNGNQELQITENGNNVIPTKISQLTNDSNYVTQEDIPSIPTKVSQLENDADYATKTYVDNAIANIDNSGNSDNVDLSDYYTKQEVDELFAGISLDDELITIKDTEIRNISQIPTDKSCCLHMVNSYLLYKFVDDIIYVRQEPTAMRIKVYTIDGAIFALKYNEEGKLDFNDTESTIVADQQYLFENYYDKSQVNKKISDIELTPGPQGEKGTTFTPSVSEEGVISWTNDGDLDNPEQVNIKGPAGQDGSAGADGAPGQNATINGENTLQIVAGDNVQITQEDGVLTISATGGTASPQQLVNAPIGAIMAWYDTAETVPAGWHVCDGEEGTLDLRGQFLLGANENHLVGETGGSEEVTLTLAQMPSHTHEILNNENASSLGSWRLSRTAGGTTAEDYITKTAGGSKPHQNMPPYRAVIFIQKISESPTDYVTEDRAKEIVEEITIPTKEVTEEEYNALTEEEKQANVLYLVEKEGSGGSSGVTMDQVNEAIDSAIGDINSILDTINGEVV